MTLNDEIGALVLKNTRINPVNQTAYKNAFLLLSSTRALNELVSNTKPSDRARKEGIEDDAAYLKTPSRGRSDRKDPDAPDPNAPKPKARKKAPPKTDATPAQKPKPAPAPAPKKGRGRPKDADETKAAKKAVKSILKTGVKNVADKVKVDNTAKLKAETKAAAKETAKLKAETAKLAKEMKGRIDLGDTTLRGGNASGSDRRLGTKTQKKKK